MQSHPGYLAIKKGISSLCFVVMILSGDGVFAQLHTAIDTTQMRIGEELLWTLEVEADSTDLVMFPEGVQFGAFEVIRNYPIDTLKANAGRRGFRLRKRYGLTVFDSGAYALEPQRVLLGDQKLESDAIEVMVYSVVVDTTQQELFDIKPSIEVPLKKTNPWRWMFLVVGIVLAAFAIRWWWQKRKIKKTLIPLLPPFEEAMHRLLQVDQATFLAQGNVKEYYSELVDIVKRYVSREVDDRALESTTEELIQRLYLHQHAGHLTLKTTTITELKNILQRSDLIKFAKGTSSADQTLTDRQGVEQIIIETKAALPEEDLDKEDQEAILAQALAEKKRRRKIKIAALSVLALLLSTGGFVAYYGYQNTVDKIFGNPLRSYAEGQWYTSAYGVPALEIQTPEILKRQVAQGNEDALGSQPMSVFEAYSLNDYLYVSVSVSSQNTPDGSGLEQALEAALKRLEQQGAGTMIVKQESFETDQGLKGLSAHGTFYYTTEPGKTSPEQSTYELLVFGQQGGVQTVLVVYKDDLRYAQDIKDRIVNSIAIELPEQNNNPKKPTR